MTVVVLITIASVLFCKTNKQALFYHLFYFYSISQYSLCCILEYNGSQLAFLWNVNAPFKKCFFPQCIMYTSSLNAGTATLPKNSPFASVGKQLISLPQATPAHLVPLTQSKRLTLGGRSPAEFWQNTGYISHPCLWRNLAGLSLFCFSAPGFPIINTIPQAHSPKDIRLSLEEIGV